MYKLDLMNVIPKNIYDIGKKFRGTSPDGDVVSFTNYYMQKNGRPFFGVSGEMHFSRVDPDMWEDTVIKMKCGGVNIISTYVFWIVHEEEEGVFRFDGRRNFRRFLEICEKHGMYVIARIGPFAHGEMRNGGLPDWLYGKPYDVRNDNEGFMNAVRLYFRALHEQMKGHYYSEGGCIVAAQIDNEYQHSAAPWEITTGVSSEWVNGGYSGMSYMNGLKKIMTEERIVTPFYTATAWGGAVTPVDEALPLWGGYSYQPWIFYNKRGQHPATPEYIYRDNHNNEVTEEYNFAPSYPPESRPYACCEMMGGMMCSYNYRFKMDMRAIDAMANIKLGSGCNLLGYYMYKGGTTPTGKRTPYLNESQISKRSYDYQAAVGEFGQIRESYNRLRMLHYFCQSFSGFFEETKAIVPEHIKNLDPYDLDALRFSVRVKDGGGFVFVNNFQDHIDMRDREDDEILLRLSERDVKLCFSIAAGENAILPFNITLDGVRLLFATAQPITKVGDTWFFMEPDGMKAEYRFDIDGKGLTVRPTAHEVISAGGLKLVTLTRCEAGGFYKFSRNGEDVALLSTVPLLDDGETIVAETEDGGAVVSVWDGESFVPHTLGKVREREYLTSENVGVGRYTVKIPTEKLKGHKTVLLRVNYYGDIGHAFINGELINDNFYSGGAWDVRLDSYASRFETEPLTLYITPKKEHVTVDVSSAMAGRIERSSGLKAEVLSLELVTVDEIAVEI